MDWLFYEKSYKDAGFKIICGVDEAGRGPLAGPVYAAAVIMPNNIVIDGVNDSKKLSAQKREKLYSIIIEKAESYSIAFSSPEEIDSLNILRATYLAMQRAVEGLEKTPDIVLIDGNGLPDISCFSKAIVKGDGLSHSIACASILAKVSRDRFMIDESGKYPNYGFDKHKGYGTAIHTEAIKKYGSCPIHRKSFLKKILKDE